MASTKLHYEITDGGSGSSWINVVQEASFELSDGSFPANYTSMVKNCAETFSKASDLKFICHEYAVNDGFVDINITAEEITEFASISFPICEMKFDVTDGGKTVKPRTKVGCDNVTFDQLSDLKIDTHSWMTRSSYNFTATNPDQAGVMLDTLKQNMASLDSYTGYNDGKGDRSQHRRIELKETNQG